VIVVDNASTDGTAEFIRSSYPDVKLVVNETNLGFPRANNLGFSLASGQYLLVLNPDTEIHEQTIQRSIAFLDEYLDYGCVGVKTRKPTGEIQMSCARQFPTPFGIISVVSLLDKVFPRLFVSQDMTFWDHESSRDVDMLQGSYMMIRKEIIELHGGFDERLSMFLEDSEFCLRLARNGYKIRYLAEVEITHHMGKSTGKAVQEWIATLRFEGFYLFIKELYGSRTAKQLVRMIMVLLPIRLLYLPIACLYIYTLKRENRLRLYLSETIAGIKWSIAKLQLVH
jgi:hypothetical protein